MAEVKLKEETELWEPRGPCGSWGPAEERTHGSGSAVEPAHLKEEEPELCIKQEPQEFPLHMVSVKSEEDEDKSSVLHQRATEENREETNVTEAGCSSDPLTQFHSDSEEHTDSSEDTEHSEDYSQQQAHSKRSYAMVPPGAAGSDRPFSCSECGKSFTLKSKLNKHMLVHSEEIPHKCSVCAKSFKFKSSVTNHEKIFHNICRVCETGFKDETSRKLHMKTHQKPSKESRKRTARKSSEKTYSCSFCEKCFYTKSDLERHIRIHTGERPYVCQVCEEDFTQMSCLSDHQKYVHHMCPVCKECFPDRMKLIDHLKTHVEDGTLEQSVLERKYMKRHICSQCGKECRTNSDLVKHMTVHTGERPYKCPICEEDFIFKFKVDQHLRFVHRTCSVCKEEFLRDTDLTEHLKAHVEDGTVDSTFLERVNRTPYSCCGKTFELKSNYQMHMLVHTGEKPFKCSVCEKTFARKNTLNTHLKTHTGEKPFKCSLCEKTFTQSGSLKAHQMRSHTGGL
ncbi:uncharacterized protein [Eucyclogobius newberryi]|uniref:uncharacterized protein isoform X1 n=2 Tax=Eucyclogobius newberryi TaxID=166745 RepID=UPI003B59B75E